MNVAAALDQVFASSGAAFAHRGSITLSDSHSVGGSLKLAAELAEDATTATIAGLSGPLSDGARVPAGLSLTIGADTYATAAEALVQDGALSITITPAATTTYAAATAVILAGAVSWDLVALDGQLEASREARQPGSSRVGTDHAATVYVLKSKLPGVPGERLREMELTIDDRSAPVMNVVDEDPHWALIAGKGVS
jgi:hypothetical protein